LKRVWELLLLLYIFIGALYGNKKNISRRKWRWFEELRQERERDIEIERTQNY
jgi:hypothetical protein